MKHILVLFLLTTISGFAQMSDKRQVQLDSVVTNLDRRILRNLDSVHHFLHNSGVNNEERAFLFYGLIAIHYKYDYKRKGKSFRKSKEYTPYYTAKSKKGVCRDFAALYKELCDRSGVPCVVAFGRVRVPFYEAIKDFFTFRLRKSNHAWNVVKYNNAWHNMDPTWSEVYKVDRVYGKDSIGRKKFLGKIKRATRDYYDAPFEEFYKMRRAVHPAYYAHSTVYTYRTAKRKKIKRRKVSIENYDYSMILDSLAHDPFFVYKPDFHKVSLDYSGDSQATFYLLRQFKFIDLKRTSLNPLTPQQCNVHLKELKVLVEYLRKTYGWNNEFRYHDHRRDVIIHRNRIERRNQQKATF